MVLWENVVTLVTLFIMQAPKGCISKTHLLDESVQLFVSVIQEGQPKLRLSAIKCVESLIKSDEDAISRPFIVACVPELISLLETASSTHKVNNEIELSVCKESISVLELILSLMVKNKDAGAGLNGMMAVYIAMLVNLLYDSTTLGKANSFSRTLHEHCIQRLTATGPLFPDAFKSCMAASPALKAKLTEGIKANAAIRKTPKSATPVQPQIKLKMNFSNFK